ncbi:MAG: hypothetical protein J6R80_04640 [Kiritimatiellae bacterium]|nr:hypothetical protein [Kiritimatiellia bacterium]
MANLAQLKVLEDLDGFLIVDKPSGLSFTTVLKAVKRKFNLVKLGHGGSLDAMASGVLVLLLGAANKFADRVMGADRSYTGSMVFGSVTNTGDRHGDAAPYPERTASLKDVRGDVIQTEPRFCSVRREGSAGYEVVDTGEHKQFLAHVYRFDLSEEKGESREAEFSLVASKGVIVRALALDLGATLMSLRRTAIGKYKLEDAIPFERLLEIEPKDFPSCVMPLSKALQ